MNEYNQKAIDDGYKNARIALQSISDLLPNVDDNELKEELRSQYEGYEQIASKMSKYMSENGLEVKSINVVKKAMLWGSIKLKTLFNNSKNQIAEMMLKGTDMGIIELTAMLNEQENLLPEIKDLLQELLYKEETYQERLKKFL